MHSKFHVFFCILSRDELWVEKQFHVPHSQCRGCPRSLCVKAHRFFARDLKACILRGSPKGSGRDAKEVDHEVKDLRARMSR